MEQSKELWRDDGNSRSEDHVSLQLALIHVCEDALEGLCHSKLIMLQGEKAPLRMNAPPGFDPIPRLLRPVFGLSCGGGQACVE